MNLKKQKEKNPRSGKEDGGMSRYSVKELDRRLLRKVYTNIGKPALLGYPVIANGEFALAHIKNGKCSAIPVKDLLVHFEHPESLPHLKI